MSREHTAIVTGAGKRVGAHIARALLDDGWTVVAHVHDGADEAPQGAVMVVADLAESDCADRIFAAADGKPPVRLLINNAARFSHDQLGEIRPDVFDAHMAINVRAPAILIERFARGQNSSADALVINL